MHSIPFIAAFLKFADKLRFRQLFLLTLLFASWRKPKQEQQVIEKEE
ncbi:MAG: hypothetical protein ABW107_00015 [Candidatus Thiodiazotropha sp. 6PLUC5]